MGLGSLVHLRSLVQLSARGGSTPRVPLGCAGRGQEDGASGSSEGDFSSSTVSGSEDGLRERRETNGRASVSAKVLRTLNTHKAVLQVRDRRRSFWR